MSKFLWNTVEIEVPKTLKYVDSKNRIHFISPLTKSGNIATRNKKKAIILKEDKDEDKSIQSEIYELMGIIKSFQNQITYAKKDLKLYENHKSKKFEKLKNDLKNKIKRYDDLIKQNMKKLELEYGITKISEKIPDKYIFNRV